MLEHPLSVLKFGSSVLKSEDDLPIAALEIYRELRKGHRVVAVVSAFADTTDRLLQRARQNFDAPQEASLARLLATGETVSATALGMLLDDAGVPNVVLDAFDIGLSTRGPVLDAEPDGLDVAALHQILRDVSVVVISGFAGRCGEGRPTLLGRGGSDLTALFLAHQLDARTCRLIKDVDGLYTDDPHGNASDAHRYRFASWSEALRVGAALIQPKAIRYAQRHGIPFIVCAAGAGVGTKIGNGESKYETGQASRDPLRVGLAGLGTVGLGVYRWLVRRPEQFDVVTILVRDTNKERPGDVPTELLTHDPRSFVDKPLDVVVELIGGTDTADFLVRHALAKGLRVVTANKALVGSTPAYLERTNGVTERLSFSAAVGGAVPVLERVSRLAQHLDIQQIDGVLNGTCNYVLDRLAEGCEFSRAVREAQDRGFAEEDPTLDLTGKDSAYKLAVTAAVAFGAILDPESIPCEGIDGLSTQEVQHAAQSGLALRLVARLTRTTDGWAARVAPTPLPKEDPLAQVRGEENVVVIRTRDGKTEVLHGKGAGRWPTTISVVADLLDLYRRRTASPGGRVLTGAGSGEQ